MEKRRGECASVTLARTSIVTHLDNNFLIDALVPGSTQEAQLVSWLGTGETLGISAIAWGEFLCGPLSPAAEAFARSLFPGAEALERADAEKAAELFNLTGRRSRSYMDCCTRPSPFEPKRRSRPAIGVISCQWSLMDWC